MNTAHLRNLEDDELLRELDDKCHHSPVIKLLCERLEAALAADRVHSARADCPICLGEVEADYDEGNDILSLKLPS